MPPTVSGLLNYLAASPSPYHAVREATDRLDEAGWKRLHMSDSWTDLSDRAYVTSGGALIAWNRPDTTPLSAGFRIVGAHTDSPNLRLKPRPDTASMGWRQLAVEMYGGALLNSWLDRDLGLSGRVVTRDDTYLVHLNDPIARVPQLAIHLDRDVNEKGVQLDKQQHLTPIWGLGPTTEGDFSLWLSGHLGVRSADILSWDLMFHDIAAPALLGPAQDLIASARLDNLVSCWCALEALLAAEPTDSVTPLVCLFDHEEVGSESATGAAGPLLQAVLERLTLSTSDTASFRRSIAASACVSSDMAHAVHPNYPERHEPAHRPLPNAGPVIKINANQRYATDALTHAMFLRACETAGVPSQVFVSKNSMPCGSTIGPITATRLGIPTVDVGCAQLSMHSARELCGAADPILMVAALGAFFVDARGAV
jgi:aspartyl aminopeptidase